MKTSTMATFAFLMLYNKIDDNLYWYIMFISC